PGAVALGSDVTGTLADARLSANVALLNGNQTFSSSNTCNGVSSSNNSANKFVGLFTGNGAGLTNLSVTNASSTLAGDVTGTTTASTVARIRGVNVNAAAPPATQLFRYTTLFRSPGAVALGSDVTGTLADARLSANVALLNGNQTFSSSNT